MNETLPGNPRYQPKQLIEYFGYDNLYRTVAEVEIANLKTLIEFGIAPASLKSYLTPKMIESLLSITTTQIDATERNITKHDIRAWVYEAQKVVGPEIAPWLHLMLTSYDALDTARIVQYVRAHQEVIRPACRELIEIMITLVRHYAEQVQIGRTHGQHALPITVGFWLATILNRWMVNYILMDEKVEGLVGKISGAVGAYNAQLGLGAMTEKSDYSYEETVLDYLDLDPAPISTQILPPEPLAYYLHSCAMMSASLAQFGRDCRHLMRSEIGELAESFSSNQSGSSTMAHKRNPVSFENLEGMWIKTKHEFSKVMDTLISEHQRDLTSSSVYRDFPTIIINLTYQMNTLLKKDVQDMSFLERINIDVEACQRNFDQNSHLILSEPLYIALQLAGYKGDAHKLVNHTLVPRAQKSGLMLAEEADLYAEESIEFNEVWQNLPALHKELLYNPSAYIGLAMQKANDIADRAEELLLTT